MVVRLSPNLEFDKLQLAVAEKFRESSRFFQDARMVVTFEGRDLSEEEEAALVDTITENSEIEILCVAGERPKDEEYHRQAAMLSEQLKNAGQFYRGDILDGENKEFDTNVVILGDIQPLAKVTSRGSIVVLGSCRGTVAAGYGGDRSCFIAALVMKPNTVQIANRAVRSAIVKRVDHEQYPLDPRIAYIREDHIHVQKLVRGIMLDYLAGHTEKPNPAAQQNS